MTITKSMTNGNGYVMTYVYDAFNRLMQVKDPEGSADDIHIRQHQKTK